jgi:hypothetical protein
VATRTVHVHAREHVCMRASASVQECYRCLPEKTLAFLLAVHRSWRARWVAKVDDDVYLAPSRLLRALPQWDSLGADYVGCMKTAGVISNSKDRWYEPRGALLGHEYFMHALGSLYVVSGRAVHDWIAPNAAALRLLSNEGALCAAAMHFVMLAPLHSHECGHSVHHCSRHAWHHMHGAPPPHSSLHGGTAAL